MYERLINFTSDAGTKDALQFLMTREITHMRAFTAALESMNKPRFMIGKIPPTAGLVDQYFNDSTGEGEDGEIDARGPWNQGEGLQLVESPAFQALREELVALRDRVDHSPRKHLAKAERPDAPAAGKGMPSGHARAGRVGGRRLWGPAADLPRRGVLFS